ncbi:dihydroorotase [Clostridium sp. MSJ-11]|uniref:Dihydroorotase n=1 Tax=Clostridium mobile TaxID=2841512 RepID=A0ABS6EK04_9CLOT|nr:dihydroorotase [Clostridium mobile]MBU5485383.1 dihydroorotase [Clostridium mobile]
MELLIKGARVVDWSQDFYGDVYIKDGIIDEIGKDIKKDCKIINGQGKVLMPAFIDLHVHFREPGFTYKEDIESGSRAAVRGGYTAVNLMANTNPVCSNMEIINGVLTKGREVNLVDIHQVASITKDFDGKTISHIDSLDDRVRIISEDGKEVMNSNIMLNAMLKAKAKNITVMCHCENDELIEENTRLAENTMTWRNVTLAKYTGCPVHIAHVSTKEAMEYIIEGKKTGHKITCEVTPHHIALTDEVNYRVNPPIRKKEDVKFLIDCIKEGLIDTISTDHAPHTLEDKLKGAPGISGIETSFSICYTKLVREEGLSLNKLSELMSKNPSGIMGMNKGEIKIGLEGDVVLVDIEKQCEIEVEKFMSKGRNTPFSGMKFYGEILKTIKSGRIVYDNVEEEQK